MKYTNRLPTLFSTFKYFIPRENSCKPLIYITTVPGSSDHLWEWLLIQDFEEPVIEGE